MRAGAALTHARRRSRESWLILASALAFLAALGGLMALALSVDAHTPGAADLDVARSIQDVDLPGWRAFIDLTEFLSRPQVTGAIALIAIAGFVLHQRRVGTGRLEAGMVIAALIVWAPKLAIGELVARERPTAATLEIIRTSDGFAFPSGHTTGAFVIYGVLLLILLVSRRGQRHWRVSTTALVVVLVLGAAVGRVVLGAHWPSDVLGAGFLSVAWLIGLAWGYRWRRARRTASVKR